METLKSILRRAIDYRENSFDHKGLHVNMKRFPGDYSSNSLEDYYIISIDDAVNRACNDFKEATITHKKVAKAMLDNCWDVAYDIVTSK